MFPLLDCRALLREHRHPRDHKRRDVSLSESFLSSASENPVELQGKVQRKGGKHFLLNHKNRRIELKVLREEVGLKL